MLQTFRATPKAWLMRVVLPLALGCSWMLWVAIRLGNLYEGLFLAIPAVLYALLSTVELARSRVEMDSNGVVAHVGGQAYEVPWRQVTAAAWSDGLTNRAWLRLVTESRIYTFPVGPLSQKKIWRLVQTCAPPSALERAAFERALAHPGALVPCVDLADAAEGPIQVRVAQASGTDLGLVLVLCGAILVIGMLRRGPNWVVLAVSLLLIFGGLALVVVFSGTLRMDDQKVCYRGRLREQAMRWDKVTRIEAAADGTALVLHGRDELLGQSDRMDIPGPAAWRGRDRNRCAAFLEARAHRLGIPIRLLQGRRARRDSRDETITEGDLRREEERRQGKDRHLPGF